MTSRTTLAYVLNILEDNWTEDIPGRFEPVPKPYMEMASSLEETRVDPSAGDIVFVRDGGPESRTPKGAGWGHDGSEANVTIDIRTSVGRHRLEGTRNQNNESERYGGLRGEVLRILHSVRKGDKEFDLINPYEWNDLSEDMGFQFFRGTWEVRLRQVAVNVDPEP